MFPACFRRPTPVWLTAIKLVPPMLPGLWCCTVGLSLGLSLSVRLVAASLEMAPYQVGDIAGEEVAAPTRLVVVDPERTEELRRQEAQKIQAIFLFHSNAVYEVETNFHQTYQETRTKFLEGLDKEFPRRALNAMTLTNPKFEKFVTVFQRQNKSFPVSTNLARVWALREADEPMQHEWGNLLRRFMGRYVRPDPLPPAARAGPAQVRLLSAASTNMAVDLSTAGQAGTNIYRTNLIALSKIKQELKNQFPSEEQTTGNILANFLKPNCIFAEELTLLQRAKQTESIVAATEFLPGQIIVKAGQRVDEIIKAALDQVQTQATLTQLGEETVQTERQLQAAARRHRWLMAGTLGLAMILAFAFWWRRRVKRARSLLPAAVAGHTRHLEIISCPAWHESITLPAAVEARTWQQRALSAEKRAVQAMTLVKAGLLPQMARWLGERLVRGMITQRAQMLELQQQAAREIEELEKRLAEIHAPLTERLLAYENRIAELEQQLAAKDAENRALLQAKLAVTRQKLTAQHEQQPVRWN